VEPLASQAIHDEPSPAGLIGTAKQNGITILAVRREAFGIDKEDLLARLRGS
jgi:hypothetical protein